MPLLTVGPHGKYDKPCQAIAAARPGDTITIDARGNGGYDGDVCAWSTDRLTIRGVHGRAHVDAAGRAAQGKAIWVIGGDHTRIVGVRLTGARVPDRNGAGIRQEGTGLTVVDSVFTGNEDGILAGDDRRSDIVIDRSEFARNGAGDGQSHNLYVGAVRSLTFRRSSSHDARVGHLLKSRALRTTVVRSRLRERGGTGSYELDVPNGGRTRVVRSVIEQGSNSQNPALIAFGEEGDLHPRSRLTVRRSKLISRGVAKPRVLFAGPGVRSVFSRDVFSGVRRPR